MNYVVHTPNPNIAQRDASDGAMQDRNNGTPQCARRVQSSQEIEADSISLQDEDRQIDHEPSRPMIMPTTKRHIRFYKDDSVKESIETEMYNLQQSYQDRMDLLQDRLNQEYQEENPASYFQNEETSATTSTARSPSTQILHQEASVSSSTPEESMILMYHCSPAGLA